MNTLISYRGLQYFQNSKGWWVDARDTYVARYYWCESESDCTALIDALRDEELRREQGTAARVRN
jgi:hypothetical protein